MLLAVLYHGRFKYRCATLAPGTLRQDKQTKKKLSLMAGVKVQCLLGGQIFCLPVSSNYIKKRVDCIQMDILSTCL